MAAHYQPAQEDPRQLAESRAFWHSFMNLLKWVLIVTAVILAGLAAAFVPF